MDWAYYEESWTYYQNYWVAMDQALYEVVQRHPTHACERLVVMKVALVDAAYSAGLARHVPRNGGDDDPAAVKVARRIVENGDIVDRIVRSARDAGGTGDSTSELQLRKIVELHAEFDAILCGVTREGHGVPSFASKYLHFHAPGVPIYDSQARSILQAAATRTARDSWELDTPKPAQPDYYDFCDRFLTLWNRAIEQHRNPTVKRLDQFLRYCFALSGSSTTPDGAVG